jgi:hypothetical protein
MRSSMHMFAVAVIWGSLCVIRGILLLSYDISVFNHQTHSVWAAPATLLCEGTLIYIVVLVFFLASRNQDTVVAAEREARRRLERGVSGSGGVGGAGGGGGAGGVDGGNEVTVSGRLKLGGDRGGGGGGRGGGGGAGGDASNQLGLPIYSTWSSHSQTPSCAVSENFGPPSGDGGASGAGSGAPVQSRLFYEDG